MSNSKPHANRWVIFIVIYLACVVAAANMMKVPSVMNLLMDQLQISTADAGNVIAVFSITGLILVFPGAAITSKIGAVRNGVLCLALLVVGGVLGAVAPSLTVLLVSRVIEGAGLAMIGVVGSGLINTHFYGKEVAIPMSIWSTWFPVGGAVGMLISSKAGYAAYNWRASWWALAAVSAVILILWAALVREGAPGWANKGGDGNKPQGQWGGQPEGKKLGTIDGILTPRVWLVSIVFLVMMFGSVGYASYATRFYTTVLNMTNSTLAGSIASLSYWFSAVGGILAGFVNRSTHNKKIGSLVGRLSLLLVCAVVAMIIYPYGFTTWANHYYFFTFVIGFFNGYACAVIMSAVPQFAKSPKIIGASMSVVFFCQTAGAMLASKFYGQLIGANSWDAPSMPCQIAEIIGVVCALAALVSTVVIQKKKAQQGAEAGAGGWDGQKK